MLRLAGTFDRFDIAEAYHAFRVDWQVSPCFLRGRVDSDAHGRREPTLQEIDAQLHRIRFSAGAAFRGYESLSENARLFYDCLCVRFGYKAPADDRFARLSVCVDCLMAIANDDYSGMDDETEARVRAGIEAHGWLMAGDSDEEETFSRQPCDVCGTQLAGTRHEALEDTKHD